MAKRMQSDAAERKLFLIFHIPALHLFREKPLNQTAYKLHKYLFYFFCQISPNHLTVRFPAANQQIRANPSNMPANFLYADCKE